MAPGRPSEGGERGAKDSKGRKGASPRRERPTGTGRKRSGKCRFCTSKREVDYKDVKTLQKLSTPQGKIYSRKRSGNCAYHQRKVERAVKRARFLALLPYTGRT